MKFNYFEFEKKYGDKILKKNTILYDLLIYPNDEKAIEFLKNNEIEDVLVKLTRGINISHTLPDSHLLFLNDKLRTRSYLCSDYFGKLPIYWEQNDDQIYFDMTLSTLKQNKKISLSSINFFLTLQFIPAPFTIWENVYKFSPGQILICEEKKISYLYKKMECTDKTLSLTETIDNCGFVAKLKKEKEMLCGIYI